MLIGARTACWSGGKKSYDWISAPTAGLTISIPSRMYVAAGKPWNFKLEMYKGRNVNKTYVIFGTNNANLFTQINQWNFIFRLNAVNTPIGRINEFCNSNIVILSDNEGNIFMNGEKVATISRPETVQFHVSGNFVFLTQSSDDKIHKATVFNDDGVLSTFVPWMENGVGGILEEETGLFYGDANAVVE